MSFQQSLSNHLPINHYLKVGEQWVADDLEEPYRLHVTLPPSLKFAAAGKCLTFNSRERSTGTGVVTADDETTDLETINDGPLDPHFFQKGFYLEAKTGFSVWPGSRLLLQALLCDLDETRIEGSSFERLQYWQDRLLRASTPLNIIELGAGIGLVGGSLAAAGGHVLMTDLNVLVNHGMGPNLVRNQNEGCTADASSSPFLTSMLSLEQNEDDASLEPISIGSGYARPAILDWFKPVSQQLSHDAYSNVDLIVACDCIFLRKLVDPMFDAVAEIFSSAHRSEEVTCLFTYQRRNLMGVFIPLDEVLDKIAKRGWHFRCLAWRKVVVEDDGEHELYLFEISGQDQNEIGEEKKE